MRVPILIEPKDEGGFRATAGEPFAASADAPTMDDAARALEILLRQRLKPGTRLAFVDLDNGAATSRSGVLQFEPVPGEDWFFDAMREAIDENRRREDEAEQ